MKKNWKVIAVSAGGVLVLAVLVVLALNRSGAPSESDALVDVPQEDTTVLLYGIDVGKYDLAENTVEFGDGEFECDVTQLYPGSHLDEEGYLITAKGEKLDLTDTEVNVEVGLHDITMSDDPEAGGARGNIISLIYKSEYYRYIVRTENEEDYVLACEDLWNENDYVSLIIPKDKIKLTLKNPEESKK